MDSILLYSFLPEFFLSLCILCQLLYGVKLINNLTYNYPIIDRETFSHFFFIILVIIVAFLNLKIEGSFSHFLFVNDESTRLVKLILIFSVFFIIHVVFQSFSMQNLNFFEYFVIFLLATFSLLLLISSFDLMSLYLLIEMQALCFYVLATFKRNSSFATESGLKYFIAGAFISGIFLLGASFIYGILGTLNMESIYFLLNFDVFNYSNEFNNILLIGSMFIIITFLFKIACAPFHY
jgi:NADH-quinone oxidoreductase subunit N